MKTTKIGYSLNRKQFVQAQKDILRAVTLSRWNYWMNVLQGLPEYTEPDNRNISVTFSDQGVEFVHPRFSSTVKWDYYSKLTETPDFILLVAADRSGATAIPKTAFSNLEDVHQLPLKRERASWR